MKTNKIHFFLTATAFFFALASCKKDQTTDYDCSGINSTYTTQVKTIIDNNCATAGCHSATSQAGRIDLSNYNTVKAAASNENFMGSLEHKNGFLPMPQGMAKLSDENLRLIGCWIQNSMPE